MRGNKMITFELPNEYIQMLDILVSLNIVSDRSKAIRIACKEFIAIQEQFVHEFEDVQMIKNEINIKKVNFR